MPQKPLDSDYVVVGWWPGSSPHGCLPVLPDYRAHRGLLSSGL